MFKLNKTNFIFIIFSLFMIFFISNVEAYEVNGKDYKFTHASGKSDSDVKKACIYTSDGYHSSESFNIVFIYNDNSAYYNWLDESGKIIDNDYTIIKHSDIYNWDKTEADVAGLEDESAKDTFLSTNKCAETLYYKSGCLFAEYHFLGYDKNLDSNENEDTVIDDLEKYVCNYVSYYKVVQEEQYTQEDLTSCEYQDFYINYTKKDGVVRETISKNNVPSTGLIFNYYISDSYRKNYSLLDEMKCPVVYECNTTGLGAAANIFSYSLYVDQIEANEEHEGCAANRRVCIGGEYCDPTYLGICPIFDKLYGHIKDKYTEYNSSNNISSLNEAKNTEEELSQLCRQITRYTDYNSPCMEQCRNLHSLLEVARGDKFTNVNGQCGFSGKLITWIANIVKWGKYLVPVVVIVMGIIDFIQAIAADKDDGMKKAQGRFIKRLIAAALIFILPFIIEFVLNKMGFDANGCGIIDL